MELTTEVVINYLSFPSKFPPVSHIDYSSFYDFYPPNQSMNLSPFSVALLFLSFFITFEADFTGGDVSINCGSSGISAASNGRQWLGDFGPKLSPLLQLEGLSTASTTIDKLTCADPVPHKTARISPSQFAYAFQLNAGQKIIRLHFNPSPYRGFKGLRDLFTVEAGPFTLLANFSASLTAHALAVNTFAKEFCLNIQQNQRFTITFSPETSQSLDTYAFINGIEIISIPPGPSYFDGDEIGLRLVGQYSMVYVDHSTALEIVHRLRITPDIVRPTGDFDGVFPKPATQRADADKVRNSTWKIPVDMGFSYLIRLHFSETGLKIAGVGGSMFKILINEMIAHTNINTEMMNGWDHDILYKDYMVVMRGHKEYGRRDILISFQSFEELADGVGVLAGFEILKLSNPDDSLASPNPQPPSQGLKSNTIRNLVSVLGYKHATATVAVAVISVLSIILHKLREIWEAWSTEDEHKPSVKAERHCRLFSLAEIKSATRNFNSGLVIGRGGFGKVYKGLIDNGQKYVAVKRLKWNSKQGAREFLTEIETLSELRHINLVSLIGYCSEHSEMILVYEYMACGTLADHLYKLGSDCSLTWKQCLNICIGAARGLDYLHTGNGIIHRDVKASNILLDENFVAKVSDFGLAKTEDRSKLQSHVSTLVKGTRGYFDPYYIRTGKLTRKSDFYAFGVVLLEALCGRSALDVYLLEEERLLSSWAVDKINKGEVSQIVASNLREEISPGSLKTFVEVAERCLLDEPKYRPTMSQIVLQLESALEQHDSKEQTDIGSVINDVYLADEDIILSENTDVQTVTSPEAIAIGPHQPEKLIRILDKYEVLEDLIPDIMGLFSDEEAGVCVRIECQDALQRLGECAKATFLEFENALASNVSSNAFPGGGVHPLTRYVMNYIKALIDYSRTLDNVLKDRDNDHDHEDSVSVSVSPDSSPVSEENDSSGSSSASVMAVHFRSLISILECNLDGKSKLYKEESLQHLFLMNNIHYMAGKVGSELRKVIGDDWIRKHNRQFQQHAMNYERATWSSILALLRDKGFQNPRTLKERLQSFYLSFEEVYKSQTGWSIPDPQLRDDLRISTSLKVIQAYRTYVGRHTNHISEKHIKYSADDLEDYLMDLFQGSQKSLHGSRLVNGRVLPGTGPESVKTIIQ